MKNRLLAFILPALLASALLLQAGQPDAGEWSWYRTVQVETEPVLDVPYVPTPREVVDQMLSLADVNRNDILYDLGCGDGRIVVTAAKERRVKRGIGVDIDPKRIEESMQNARQAQVSDRVTFQHKDLFEVDFSEATVVSLYLLPSVNLKLRPKLLRELKPGSRIVSHDFDMAEWEPDKTARMGQHTVYLWVVPASVSGTWKWNYSKGAERHSYELRLLQSFQKVESAELIADGSGLGVRDVRLNGERLEFTVDGDMNGLHGPVRFAGVVRGEALKGMLSSKDRRSDKAQNVRAERDRATAAPADAATAVRIQL